MELKSKYIILLITVLLFSQSAFSQDCILYKEGEFVENIYPIGIQEGIINDSVLQSFSKKAICVIYASINRSQRKIYVLSGDSINQLNISYFSNDTTFCIKKCKIEEQRELEEVSFERGSYVFCSNNLGRHFFDWCFFKYNDKIIEIAPMGCSLFNNMNCIKKNNKELFNLLQLILLVTEAKSNKEND